MQGSIDAAMARLDEYRGRLESRIIERYDAAVVGGMLTTMAQCARIMVEFQRGEETCVQVHPTHTACSTHHFCTKERRIKRGERVRMRCEFQSCGMRYAARIG